MLAGVESAQADPLLAPTILAFRVLLTDRTRSDVSAIVQTLARVLPKRLPRCIPLFVAVGDDPRQISTLACLPTVDCTDPSKPLSVQPMAIPQFVYRGSKRLGIGDVYRIVLPLARALDAHLILSDADRQISVIDSIRFGRWALRHTANQRGECYGVPQRAVRNFSPALERKVEEDLMNGAVRLAVAQSLGAARLRQVWAGGYPIRDAQASLFVLSRGAVRAVLEDGVVSGYLNSFGPQEALWGGDLIVQYAAVCAAARLPRGIQIVTRPVVPSARQGHATIDFDVLRQKWREVADHLGVDLQRVQDAVSAEPYHYLQADVLAEVSNDRRGVTCLVDKVCRELRRTQRLTKVGIRRAGCPRCAGAEDAGAAATAISSVRA